MVDDFEELRDKLHKSIDKYGINAEKTMKISKRFDELVVKYYKKEKQYDKNSTMFIMYEESIRQLKKITKDFAKFPSIEEWNYYAKPRLLLNSESLKYISGLNWHDLRNKLSLEK